MARKSGFEEMVDAAALLPWYVSLILAFGSYLFLHALSLESVPASPGQMDKVVLIGFSAALQYLVPLVFLCGALFSFLHSHRKREIFDSQTSLHSIRALSWQEFEWLVSEAYRRQGYNVVERGGNAPDGGVDLELRKDGRKTIVQCKVSRHRNCRRHRRCRKPLSLHVPIAGATWLVVLPAGDRLRVVDSGVALDTQHVSERGRCEVMA